MDQRDRSTHFSDAGEPHFDLAKLMVLTVDLAIINLLPLPILDGGIIVRALLEKQLRRKVATKILMHTQLAFVMLILGHNLGKFF
jgi:membrane-associated protease RseP (regulator of RpoE activity)